MVVGTSTREVSDGHGAGDASAERRLCFEFHSAGAKAASD